MTPSEDPYHDWENGSLYRKTFIVQGRPSNVFLHLFYAITVQEGGRVYTLQHQSTSDYTQSHNILTPVAGTRNSEVGEKRRYGTWQRRSRFVSRGSAHRVHRIVYVSLSSNS